MCRLLSRKWPARLVLEEAEENPFLEKFYCDRRAYAFQTQMWFLVSRYKQLSEEVRQQDIFYRLTLSDYIFAKDQLFASVNLNEDELALYEKIVSIMAGDIPKPDLVIYLQASTRVLIKRIEIRARPYEFNIDPLYIDMLNEAYNHFFFHYSETPLLIINTDEMDFVNRASDLDELIRQIENAGKGTTFYRPMAAKDKILLQHHLLNESVPDDTVIEEPDE